MNTETLMAGGATYTPLTAVASEPDVEAPECSPCVVVIITMLLVKAAC